MKKTDALSALTVLVLVPATLVLGSRLEGRTYYLISTLIILELMVPFFLAFETRKPQAREIVIVAVLAALAAASRAAFAFAPSFKPITAIIMVSGMAFGPQTGFLVGAISAFASNFVFGQGAWTPWQMMAYGMGGFLAGVCFFGRRLPRRYAAWIRAVFGFCTIMLVVGPLLDLCSVFTMGSVVSGELILSALVLGLGMNVSHGVSCALTMVLVSGPLLSKLERLRIKFGMMDAKKE